MTVMICVATEAEQHVSGMVQLPVKENHWQTEISVPVCHKCSFCRCLGLLHSVGWTLSGKAAVKRLVQQASNKQGNKLAKSPACWED